jgi:hypothetical protein
VVGHRASQKGLAGPWRPVQQHSLGLSDPLIYHFFNFLVVFFEFKF